ncbi:MAG: phenylalanine--tRNA ligase subunit beta [Candidatus Nanopelagicales bacterium]
MRVPIGWLREFAAIPADQSGRDIAERLVAAGLEVETVDVIGGEVTGPLVVGRVRSFEELTEFRKPIRFARVEVGVGNGETVDGRVTDERGIICGARNFAKGDLVVVALPGAVLPGGFQIGSRRTYGRKSDGMMASERELAMGENHDGIIVLPAGTAEPGTSAYDVLGLGEEVLDIAVTPDRGYALSVRGVAREAALAYDLPLADPALVEPESLLAPPADQGAAHECLISDAAAANRFVLRTVTGIDPAATSPQAMRRRLIAAGMRPVSLPVDITNYLMLELGQPLHAFDRAKLYGPLQVRRAAVGEKLTTLDHVERALTPADVLIADAAHPLALAGTMGGLDSEIDGSTTEVVIEAVHFDALEIARMSRRHKLSSEASKRFERGVDPDLPTIASARAAALLAEHAKGTYVGVNRVDAVAVAPEIEIAEQLATRTAGLEVAPGRSAELLTAIGCQVVASGEVLAVVPPSWRPDLTDPADLAEEVIRLVGYHNLPSTMPPVPAGYGLTEQQRRHRQVSRQLAGFGLSEVWAYPFIAADELDALGVPAGDPRRQLVRLANPIADTAPYLRTSLLPGLLQVARRNLSRGSTDLAIFETGSVFRGNDIGVRGNAPRPPVSSRPTDEQIAELEALLPGQPRHAAGVLSGAWEAIGWWGPGRLADWSDAIAAVRAVADDLGVALEVRAGQLMPWHPGRCAELVVAGGAGDVVVGQAGELHPRVLAECGLPGRTCAFEFDVDALLAAAAPSKAAPVFSNYPVAKEDLAFVVDPSVTAARLEAAIRSGAGELLESVRLFDVYAGEQLGGRKSLAFSLRLRASDRTLSADEVASARAGAVSAAADACGAVLRV